MKMMCLFFQEVSQLRKGKGGGGGGGGGGEGVGGGGGGGANQLEKGIERCICMVKSTVRASVG